MSDEPRITEQDVQNLVKGQGMSAPSRLIEAIMDRVKELERDGQELSQEELDDYFGRTQDGPDQDLDLDR